MRPKVVSLLGANLGSVPRPDGPGEHSPGLNGAKLRKILGCFLPRRGFPSSPGGTLRS
jgi:hypothetical protein